MRYLVAALLLTIAGLAFGLFVQQRAITGLTDDLSAEVQSHLQTKLGFERAAADARQKAQDRVDQAYAENARIDAERETSFANRLSTARAEYDRQLRAFAQGQAARRGGGGADLPSPSDSSGLAAAAAPDPRLLVATEQAIQLDELIAWVCAHAPASPGCGAPGGAGVTPAPAPPALSVNGR